MDMYFYYYHCYYLLLVVVVSSSLIQFLSYLIPIVSHFNIIIKCVFAPSVDWCVDFRPPLAFRYIENVGKKTSAALCRETQKVQKEV